MTERFEDEEEYWEFVRMLARNNQGETARSVAKKAIVYVEGGLAEEKVLCYSAHPHTDDGEKRLWPKDVFQAREHDYPFPKGYAGELRPLAVDVLEEDIQQVIDEEGIEVVGQ